MLKGNVVPLTQMISRDFSSQAVMLTMWTFDKDSRPFRVTFKFWTFKDDRMDARSPAEVCERSVTVRAANTAGAHHIFQSYWHAYGIGCHDLVVEEVELV